MSNGNELIGEIIREDSSEIVVMADGLESKVLKAHVKQITYLNDGESVGDTVIYRTKKKEPKQEFVIGATYGTPSIFNARLGTRSDKGFSYQVCGMYSKDVYGLQFNPMLLLTKNEKTYQFLSFMVGYSYIRFPEFRIFDTRISELRTWAYIGAAYALNTRGFFLELGLTAGVGSYRSPQLMLQIGYVN